MQSQIENYSGNSFIDENHDDILLQLEGLTELLRDNWHADSFQIEFSDFVNNLENHFLHEETVLKGANFNELESHKIKHREISLELRMKNMVYFDYNDAIKLLMYTRSAVFSHELLEDQKYWPIFENDLDNKNELWSADLITGDDEADDHHKALLSFITRLADKLNEDSDHKKISTELLLLKNYSEFHFQEEEKLLKGGLRQLHRVNHEELITDLDTLITEVADGKYKLVNLGDYLKYWLINHIRKFDVPAFKNIQH